MSVPNDQDDKDISLMAKDQYMRLVRWTPFITEEEEGQLLERVERGRGEQGKASPNSQVLEEARRARDRLVEGYQGLVVRIANTYKGCFRSLELLDLIQEGNLGLLKAIERYQVREGGALMASAVPWIRGAILSAYRERDGMVRMACRTFVQVQQMRQARGRLMATLDRDPTLEEIAKAMDASVGKVRELLVYERQSCVQSLQGLLLEGTDESDYGFVSVFAHCCIEDETARGQQLHQAVHQAFEEVLTPRQQQSMRYRFGLHDQDGSCYTAVERARLMGLAAYSQTVEHVEDRAKQRLRVALAPLYGLVEEKPVRVKRPRPSLVPALHQRDYYTIDEVCQVLQLSYPTVRDRMRRGILPYEDAPAEDVLKYRFPKQAIERLAERSQPKPSRRKRSADQAD